MLQNIQHDRTRLEDRQWLHVKYNNCKNVLEPSTSAALKLFLQKFYTWTVYGDYTSR